MRDEEQIRKRIAGMHLAELKAGVRTWYYISIANDKKFLGGLYLHAFGPTDAFRIMHSLNLYPRDKDASTQTYPVPPDKVIPADKQWRLLSKQEIEI